MPHRTFRVRFALLPAAFTLLAVLMLSTTVGRRASASKLPAADRWQPTLRNAANKYYCVRVWNAGGGDLTAAKPDQPVAWLAPVWTGR